MDSVTFDEPDDDEARAFRAGAGLADLSGRQIGRYLVGQQLGTGGAATVYRAYDQVQGITVALKLLLPGADEKTYTRFRREATLAGALRHPHIVRILQIGIAPKGEVAYIAMELVEGESLADLLAQRGRLRPEETANLLEPIARALAFAHRQGVVHRDVKPGNILLRPVSPGAANSVQLESLEHPVVPLLSDFGIARALDTPELTSAGRTVGTPAYMAPEQCAGSREVDGRADLYSLGAVLYRCVTGRLPYSGTTTQILHAHVYEPLTIDVAVLRLLPPLVVEVIQRSMAKRPEDRYADADALADALALAAGRIPPLQGSSPGESTATLTLSALPAVPPEPARPETTVLVPGVGSAVTSTTTAAVATTTNPLLRPAARRPDEAPLAAATPPEHAHQLIPDPGERVGRLERLNWPGIALASVLGLLLLAAAVAFGIQGPGLLARLGGPPTPLPTPGDVSQAPATPTLQPGVVVTSTATPVPSPTALPATATATQPVPTSTLTPTPLPPPPTDTPEPTATPTETPTVTPTASPTLTPTPSVTPGPHPDLVACLDRIDPSLQSHILGKDPGYQVALGCPDQPALAGMAFVLPFERGYLVGFDMTPEMLAVYPGNNTWERLLVPEEGQGPPQGATPPTEQLYIPSGRFGWVWSQNDRQAALGYALQPEPGFFNVRYQTFPGALLLANLDSGEVVELPISQQR